LSNKVYVVRYGAYSDQGIAGAFSTEEKAKRYCDIKNEVNGFYGDYWMNEYILDEHEMSEDTKVVTYYTCFIATSTTFNQCAGKIYLEDEEKEVFTEPVIIRKYYDGIEVKSVTSPEHAQKVAIEQYQIYTQQKLEEEIMENK